MRRPLLHATLVLAALLALAGCTRRPPPAAEDPGARAQALIAAGNAAYRDSSYEMAAKRYASAAVVMPNDPAAYYGLGMALSRLGRDDDARAAYAKARELLKSSPGDSTK